MYGVTFGTKHSIRDYNLVLTDYDTGKPAPKRYLTAVPGRNGVLDLTGMLTPNIKYENRILQFAFTWKSSTEDYENELQDIINDIHGKKMHVILDSDPDYYYDGFVTAESSTFSGPEKATLVVAVDADPYKYFLVENEYTVNGDGNIVAVVDRMEVVPAFEITAPTNVTYKDSTYSLSSSKTKEETESGSEVSFADGTDKAVVSLTVDVAPVQTGAGVPSPSNPRPITGWTEANIYVSPSQDPDEASVYQVSWINSGTVYGGTLDVTNGVLDVTHRSIEVESCDLVGTASTGVKYARVNFGSGNGASDDHSSNISSRYEQTEAAPQTDGYFRVTSSYLYIYDNRFTDKATADSILAAELPQFVYKLTTSDTIGLSTVTVYTLIGQNYIWVDAGDITVTYLAQDFSDIKIYIPDLEMSEGTNTLTITSTGITKVSYRNGRL